MAIDFTLLKTSRMQMAACDGDCIAWVLHSRRGFGDSTYRDYCILVVPEGKRASLRELDALSADVPHQHFEGTLEQWLQQRGDGDKEADFRFCLDLPVFSSASSARMNALVDMIQRSLPDAVPWMFGISPNIRNWKALPLDGIVESEFNNSQAAGAQLFKFFAGLISPHAVACLAKNLEWVIDEPDNPAVLLQATWNGDAESTLTMAPNDLELLKSSADIVAVSAGTPLSFKASRALVHHLWSLAPHVEFAHAMDHCGILRDPHSPLGGDMKIHLLCRQLLWGPHKPPSEKRPTTEFKATYGESP